MAKGIAEWYPVASIKDLRERHVFQTELFGHELVVWQADDGYVNVWENRCLHRGSRLSVGINDGAELVCAYHGWRYANQTAGCTYIPAHPSNSPARTICNRVYPSFVRHGFVWSALEQCSDQLVVELTNDDEPLVLRSLPLDVPLEEVQKHLQNCEFNLGEGTDDQVQKHKYAPAVGEPYSYKYRTSNSSFSVHLMLQPFDDKKTVIHGLVTPAPKKESRLDWLLSLNTQLAKFREEVESSISVDMGRWLDTDDTHAHQVSQGAGSRVSEMEVVVSKRWLTAIDIVGFELRPVEGGLPTFQPGAHVDLHLPNGLSRQYSLINGPGEQDRYQIGVKLEQNSRGGSKFLHEELHEGDQLLLSGPHNNFRLRRDTPQTLLFAGGIGLTPLLAMAQALERTDLSFILHYFVQSSEHLAFQERFAQFGDQLKTHLGLSPAETEQRVVETLGSYDHLSQVYACGPPAMISMIRETAMSLGWPPEAVHFEYFKNEIILDEFSAFEIHLARSGMTLSVDSGSTILDVLRENGVALASSCEQGACGTCEVGLLEGEPNHQDVYLNETEHEAGTRIMTCVSRSHSDRLVLDI
ncbi:MAG: Rieske 2Fe-2S domain-containing protein [Acidimicrobiales bacterium]|nr:Rieske 2Fe-2S domain-containing protein [Acidimicrobiales bacterium]